MDETMLYPRYRYVMAILFAICASFTHIGFLITSPMLVYLAKDFSVDIATAGYASTVHILAMGVFMFVGPSLLRKIDIRRTQLIGIGIEILGVIACFFAPRFSALLAARVLTGMGHGLSGSCTNSIVAAWFPPRERPVLMTVNGLGVVGVTTLVYTCTMPLFHAFGDSWRLVMLLLSGILFAAFLSWLLFARDNHTLNAHIREKNALEGRVINAFTDMKDAITRRDVWMLCLFMGLGMMGANGITTYLPQFLQNVRGYSDVDASAVVGITIGIGAVGTFLGGIATTVLGRRKIVILPFLTVSTACIAAAILTKESWLIALFLFLYAFTNNFRTPASQTITTELRGATPTFVSSASALTYGAGFIGSFLTSPLLQIATRAVGETYAMLVFVPLFFLSIVFAFLTPETGPKRGVRG